LDVTEIILLLLLAVVASGMIERISRLPLPFVQFLIGVAIAAVFDFNIVIEPDLFLLLFIAPLLFLDGWRIPKAGLLHDRWTIGALAFGLVLLTVLGAGLFIHWLIPQIPQAIAFALAAVLSPTDAVAVSAIAARAPIPKRLMHVLEGEALLNDASGLVCLRFSVAAALTGAFSPTQALLTFLWLATGGALAGAIVALAANFAKDFVARRFGEQTGTQILVSLLIPFGAYIAAERLHASGILAAVAAGLVMGREERLGRALAGTRLRRAAVWDAVQFAANGVIFVLLGQQIPGIVAGADRAIRSTGEGNPLRLVLYVLTIFAVLALLRALCASAALGLVLYRTKRRASEIGMSPGRAIAVTTIAGARGALTLSGVMTLPLTLQDGAAFPTRELAILLAAGVIVVSLLAANIGLPLLTRDLKGRHELAPLPDEREARLTAAREAVRAIEQELEAPDKPGAPAALRGAAASRLLSEYRRRMEAWPAQEPDPQIARVREQIERDLFRLALTAEREALRALAMTGKLSEEIARSLIREVDLQESRLEAG